VCRALVPHLRGADRSDVVMISSIAAQSLAPGFGMYSVSKAAIEALAHTLAREEKPFGFACTPADIAATAAHLCSEDGRYITNRRITIVGDRVVPLLRAGVRVHRRRTASRPHPARLSPRRIILVARGGDKYPGAALIDYAATKSAMIATGKALSKKYGADNVLVNSVLPGLIHTDMWERTATEVAIANKSMEAVLAAKAKSVPVGRYGIANEVASVIAPGVGGCLLCERRGDRCRWRARRARLILGDLELRAEHVVVLWGMSRSKCTSR
jgi:NAD(P)-dependent dehydrogenase (short-subunit alcohol dehydrogenase family)